MRLLIALKMTCALTLITGVFYPLLVWSLAQALFPWQANGSLIVRDGGVLGSERIGQGFTRPDYFHGRPSTAGAGGYDGANSGGSNLGPTNKVLIDTVRTRLKRIMEENPGITPAQVPIDLVTASGSGLDPEISPMAAELQIPRVARTRGLGEDRVRKLVRRFTRRRSLGLFGEPGVNVLMLNIALDRIAIASNAAAFRRWDYPGAER